MQRNGQQVGQVKLRCVFTPNVKGSKDKTAKANNG